MNRGKLCYHQFIEEVYFKCFKKEAPEVVKPLKQILKELEIKKQKKKKRKKDAMQSTIDNGKVEFSVKYEKNETERESLGIGTLFLFIAHAISRQTPPTIPYLYLFVTTCF